MWGPLNVMTQQEEDLLHGAALRVLEQTGVQVQNDAFLGLLARAGAPLDMGPVDGEGNGARCES